MKISEVPGDTLHCIVSEFAPQHGRHMAKKPSGRSYFERVCTMGVLFLFDFGCLDGDVGSRGGADVDLWTCFVWILDAVFLST